MQGHRQIRINKEMKMIKNQSDDIEVLEINGTKNAVFVIHGPLQSPYEGFGFRIQITWPQDYPMYPMKAKFLDQIWNPYISKDGQICISILDHNQWSPSSSTRSVLHSIISLLSQKQIFGKQFLNPVAASQMKNNYYYFFDYAKNQAEKNVYIKKQIYYDSMRSKEEQVKVLQNQDGKIEHAIQKDIIQNKITEKQKKKKENVKNQSLFPFAPKAPKFKKEK